MRGSRRYIAVGVTGFALTVVGASVAKSTGPASPAAPTNLIVNGSFETPDVPFGGFATFASIPGWSHQPRPGTSGTGIELQDHAAGDPAPGAGDQIAELDSDSPSRIYQSIPTEAGVTYRLSFIYSPRPGTSADDNHFRVTAVGGASAEIGPLASGSVTNWQTFTLDFVAGEGSSTTIAFLDLGPPQTPDGYGAFIDNVVVTTQPTSVRVRSFTAQRSGKTVVLRWQTGSQARLLGFDVYRQQAEGTRVRLNARLIRARAGGGSYSIRDKRAPRGAMYVLEAHGLDGTRRQYRLATR